MLPECRVNNDVFSIPKFSVVKEDIDDFLQELEVFHGEFSDCFLRSVMSDNYITLSTTIKNPVCKGGSNHSNYP